MAVRSTIPPATLVALHYGTAEPFGVSPPEAVAYQWSYLYCVTGRVPEGRDPVEVDANILARHDIAVSKYPRCRRKAAGRANIHYARHQDVCVMLASTTGQQVFEVPMAAEAVMVEGNGFPYRSGDQVIREPQEIINGRKEAYRRVGFEQRFRLEASLDDLDLELVRRFFERTPLGGRSAEDLLEQFSLIQTRTGGWGVTNAALLLFGKTPLARWHPRMDIRFFRVAGSDSTGRGATLHREHGSSCP